MVTNVSPDWNLGLRAINSGGGGCALGSARMAEPTFKHHRHAALQLLTECRDLPHKTAGFLGHVCVAAGLTVRQRAWLAKLLERAGLPPLAEGESLSAYPDAPAQRR